MLTASGVYPPPDPHSLTAHPLHVFVQPPTHTRTHARTHAGTHTHLLSHLPKPARLLKSTRALVRLRARACSHSHRLMHSCTRIALLVNRRIVNNSSLHNEIVYVKVDLSCPYLYIHILHKLHTVHHVKCAAGYIVNITLPKCR